MEVHANLNLIHFLGVYELHLTFLNQTLAVHLKQPNFRQREQTLMGMDDINRIWVICFNYSICHGYFSFDGDQYYSLMNDGKNHFVSTNEMKNSFINKFRKKRSLSKFKQPLYIEYAVVADHSLMKKHSNNEALVRNDILDIVSTAKEILYNPFKIVLLLVDITYWKSDEIKVTKDEHILDKFQRWIKNYTFSNLHDLIHLYTNVDFDGNTAGITDTGEICNKEHTSGVIELHRKNKLSTAQIIAHEIVHAFRLTHDDNFKECKNNHCIMSSSVEKIKSTNCWSTCSQKSINYFLNIGGGMCLHNIPSKMVSAPVCGNSIVEGNEQCDCGPECSDKCCDNKTCLLTSNSRCSGNDLCCNLTTCNYSEKWTVCRKSYSECDLAELCSGESEQCPENTFKQNGILCNNNSSMCYKGKCVNLDSQCVQIKGEEHKASKEGCYLSNTHGFKFGNCGFKNGKYTSCSPDNMLCGNLFCDNTRKSCIHFNTYGHHSLLVDDGTKCGDNKYCISQNCVDIELKSCKNNCSANGYCNNLSKCQCNVGWYGIDCSSIST